MTLEVIGAGFGRTGTLSTRAALTMLGLPCYHMTEVLAFARNPAHLDFWLEVARAPAGAQHDWSRAFARYAATVDNPGCCVWRELLAAYPDAKVLLTVHPRGAEAWYESSASTVHAFTEASWQFRALELLTPFARKYGEITRKLIQERFLEGAMDDRARAVARYEAHVEEVKAAVPPERLLVFNVADGWAPLCDFLGVAPPDAPFPRLNDRDAIKTTIARYKAIAVGLVAASAAVVAAAIAGLWWAVG